MGSHDLPNEVGTPCGTSHARELAEMKKKSNGYNREGKYVVKRRAMNQAQGYFLSYFISPKSTAKPNE